MFGHTQHAHTFAALVMAACITAPAMAQQVHTGIDGEPPVITSSDEVGAVTRLLHTIEYLPDREAFARAAAHPDEILWSIVARPETPRLRASALDALAQYWPSERVLSTVVRAAKEDTTPSYMRMEYIAILGRGDFKGAAVSPLAGLLESEDIQTALAAASALGQLDDEAARQVLRRKHAAQDAHPVVQERIEMYMP